MGFLGEFRAFIQRGNVLDLATAVVVGGAFQQIVNSLVKDIITPPLGVLIGGVKFESLVLTLVSARGEEPAVTINFGVFVQAVINFIIISFVIFTLIRLVAALKKKQEEAPAPPPEPTPSEVLLTEIRDLLSRQAQK
jgi:large conductance mechanosensitive channel